jgi:uncharacterized protein (TIGR02147 family)
VVPYINNGKETIAGMISVFNFTDFREYLQYYFKEKKTANPDFSYQQFAQKTGISNRGFLYNILKGKKPLSRSHCFKFSQALGHSGNEALYFENIVSYAQTKNAEKRARYLEQALQVQSNTHTKIHLIRQDQYEFYSKWYHSAIRAYIDMFPFNGDYEELTEKLSPVVTVAQAEQSVHLLERLGLIKKDESGLYTVTEKSIWASNEVAQTAISRFHIECTDLARNAIIHENPKTHNIISLTMGISKNGYQNICEETRIFKDKIIELVNSDKNTDRIYQYQLFFLPLSSGKSPFKD